MAMLVLFPISVMFHVVWLSHAGIFSLSCHMNGFLEPHTACEGQQCIDSSDLLLILDFDWLISSVLAKSAAARKNHSLRHSNYWILKRWKQHSLVMLWYLTSPCWALKFRCLVLMTKDKCKNRKMSKSIKRRNGLYLKTLTKHSDGTNLNLPFYNSVLTLYSLRYRAKFSLFNTI